MAAHFAIVTFDEAPDPGRLWVRCLDCLELVEDYPPAKTSHRRRHTVKPMRRSAPLTLGQREIRHAVFERDGWRCQLRGVEGAGSCHGPLTPHHRRKASQGGPYTLDNLATLCRAHNDLLEARADVAAIGKHLGLVLGRDVHTCGAACLACGLESLPYDVDDLADVEAEDRRRLRSDRIRARDGDLDQVAWDRAEYAAELSHPSATLDRRAS